MQFTALPGQSDTTEHHNDRYRFVLNWPDAPYLRETTFTVDLALQSAEATVRVTGGPGEQYNREQQMRSTLTGAAKAACNVMFPDASSCGAACSCSMTHLTCGSGGRPACLCHQRRMTRNALLKSVKFVDNGAQGCAELNSTARLLSGVGHS